MGWWICRAEGSSSRSITSSVLRSVSVSKFCSGSTTVAALYSAQLAKDSFSQMSSHQSGETRSPNHWCASSCACTVRLPRFWSSGESGSRSSSRSRNVTAPAFSMAPAAKSGTARTSSFWNGNPMPK